MGIEKTIALCWIVLLGECLIRALFTCFSILYFG